MKTPFTELLRSRQEAVGWTTEEILDAVLPLFEQVALAHDAGLVACIEGADHLMSAGTRLWFENRVLRPPLTGDAARAALERQSYILKMNVAFEAWQSGNLTRLDNLLAEAVLSSQPKHEGFSQLPRAGIPESNAVPVSSRDDLTIR